MYENSEEFRKVSYKRKGRSKRRVSVETVNRMADVVTDQSANIRWIFQASNREDLQSSRFYNSFVSLLENCLHLTKISKFDKIICFGLGKVSNQSCSRHQLILLLFLKNHFNVNITVSDPQFCTNDKIIFQHFGIDVEEKNLEAKYPINDNIILFYLPHCPKELSNNLLWSNWTFQRLNKCIIISNSFTQIVDNTELEYSNSIEYIRKISPYCLEFNVENNFKHYEVFSDTSIHCFPATQLHKVPEHFWEDNEEPVYVGDSEYIELIKTKT